MDERQTLHENSMRAGDGQLCIVVVQQAAPEQPGINLEIVAPQAVFNGDLPNAGCAEKQFVIKIVKKDFSLG